MSLHALGQVSLTISTLLYFIWFIPQLVLTFKRQSTNGLSIWMHAILVFGYMADLMYGFGREMPIQYRLVTIVGLLSLGIEHWQFGRYGLQQYKDKLIYISLSLVFILLFILAVYNISVASHSKQYYDIAGFISAICWFIFVWPQLIKNYKNKSAEGLSSKFVALAVITGILDTISAFALNYDWPSKLSAPVGLIQKSILLGQCYYYKRELTIHEIPVVNHS